MSVILRSVSQRLIQPTARQTIPTIADVIKSHKRRAPLRFYGDCLRAYPRLTQACTGGVLGGLGDSIAQYLEIRGGGASTTAGPGADGANQQDSTEVVASEPKQIDFRRLAAFSVFCGVWAGLPLASYIRFIEGKKMADVSVGLKIAFTHGLWNPFLYFPGFYVGYGTMMGRNQKQIGAKFLDLPRDIQNCLGFWAPVNLIQFLFVPAKAQVLFLSTTNVMWSVILSTTGNRKAGAGEGGKDSVVVTTKQEIAEQAATSSSEKEGGEQANEFALELFAEERSSKQA